MRYEEALEYWYGRIDFERRAAKPGDLKLDRMRAFLHQLGDPQQKLRLIHVAGTKGKGSTCAMLSSVLQAAGYRVGLFTSPHLVDVRERMQVNGKWITEAELTQRVIDLKAVAKRLESNLGSAPTFFEMGTALGFLHFFCRRVDFAIIEVGLGGRFDSTNVITPIVSVITNISYDHMAQLGNTLSQIAFEKSGIIKPGVPVVSTALHPEAREVICRIAAERNSHVDLLDRDFKVEIEQRRIGIRTQRNHWQDLNLGLAGQHQAENAAGVIAVVEQLRLQGIPISDQAIPEGLASVHWPARVELIRSNPVTILDCAHNVESMRRLVETIDNQFQTDGNRILILALSADKPIEEILQELAPHFDQFILTRYQSNPRYVQPEKLADALRSIVPEQSVLSIDLALDAWNYAKSNASPTDLIVITGSVFLAGELRDAIRS
jgi:dihydrofolate synthase / folylpolyglutamate synthase